MSDWWSHGVQHARPPFFYYLPEFAQTHVHWVGDAIWTAHPLLPPSPNALNLSQPQGLFQWVSSSCGGTSCGQSIGASALASILPINYSWLISFRIDWFDLLAVQGTLKSLLQHHHSKASILQCSAFFTIQLFCPYITSGKKT